ncbi:DNA translocase FtsK [uncultured Alistipes sp.]|uniref:FtsK/SpoIIIE family DNA translocase n=1 Tax=uncultured Alistipes sp. TaxID=538949 RepID=UPI0025D78CA5|nr:DNA translocase FtsK [uncultured Alistipes sp.]
MATRNSSSSTSAGRPAAARTNGDSARWIGGLVLFFTGLFAAFAVFFSYFCWAGDQSGLLLSAEERATLGVEPENLCGWIGARIGMWLVDDSFGLMGILIPVMVLLVGVRIIRQRPLLFNHSILSLLFITILGSLTLGFAFSDHWSLCSSTGWGGAFGIGVGDLLRRNLGVFGSVIALLGGWILTGVFINRNFINKVNEAGNAMVGGSERFVEVVRRKVAPHAAPADQPLDDGPAAPAAAPAPSTPAAGPAAPAPAPAVDPAADRPQTQPSEPLEPAAAPRPEPQSEPAADAGSELVIRRAAEEAPAEADDENPFLEYGPDDPAEEPMTLPGEAAADEEFTEVDLSGGAERVVMGSGGLVELARPALRRAEQVDDGPFTELTLRGDDAAPSTVAQPLDDPFAAAPRTAPQPAAPVVSDGPFTELSLAPEPTPEPALEPAPEPEPAPAAGTPEAPAAPLAPDVPAAPAPAAAPEQGVVVTVESGRAQLVDERSIAQEAYDPLKDLINYRRPPVTLLEDYMSDSEVTDEEIFENKSRIEETLKYFGIPIQRIKATVGPTVTLYEIVQAQGVKISKIQGLENDIAQSLKALGIRIIAPIPGKGTIGIEVPNQRKQVVSMYSSVRSLRFQESKAELPVVIGRTIQNENYVFDLAKMPHLLVAGATGQGKSVGLNAIITSLLYRKHPAQLKFVMIDPKMVEFSLYAKLERHFLAKMESEEKAIITDPMKAVYTLNSLCTEMDNRLELCSEAGARNIVEYNEKFTARRLNPQKGHRYMPYIVVVVDEFADLIMMAREVERPVMRLAQKARAVGIHLIIATQRPDVKVITGGIKANFPARIAFRVMQMIDSRTIIDQPGANQLIGRGDMLFSKDGELTRIQCALVETREVERIVDHIAGQQSYTEAYQLPDFAPEGGEGGGLGSEESSAPVRYDSLFAEIAREAVQNGQISTSMIQRNYEVGFNRAGRIMTQLERAGIVGRQQGAKPRDILFHDLPSLEAKLQDLGLF